MWIAVRVASLRSLRRAVVIKREVSVAAFHAGAAALEQIGAALSDLLDACAKRGREGLSRMGSAGVKDRATAR